MQQSEDNKWIPMSSVDSGKLREVAPDVAYYTNQIVNIVMLGLPGEDWVLVDTGMPKSASEILEITADRFGKDNPPKAIILTHGHFDHVGNVVKLAESWNVKVYAHPMEFPFLTGELAYPRPDTSVEGGMLAKISALYPHYPIDITDVLEALPEDRTVPALPEWEWIFIPGHSPGQIALFRRSDRILLTADAIITVKQDAMFNVLLQKEEVCGPPVYLTTDWQAAKESVLRLAALRPDVMISGHGTAMQGEELTKGLQQLIKNWEEVSVPSYGKWVREGNEE